MKRDRRKDKKRGLNYFNTLAASAPLYAAKSIGVDFPKKTLEEAYELRSKKPKTKFTSHLRNAAKGRGLGTASAGLAGIATAPLFLKGVQLAGSDKKSDKAKGMALIGASGFGYQALKGLGEGYGSAKSRGLKGKASLRRAKSFSLARAALKTPGALVLGASIAAGRKKKKGKDPSIAKKYLAPALGAGAFGAAQNITSELLDQYGKIPKGQRKKRILSAIKSRKAWKRLKAPGISGALGGAVAGTLTSGLVDMSLKRLKKREGKND